MTLLNNEEINRAISNTNNPVNQHRAMILRLLFCASKTKERFIHFIATYSFFIF
jgi:hypothetical protein